MTKWIKFQQERVLIPQKCTVEKGRRCLPVSIDPACRRCCDKGKKGA